MRTLHNSVLPWHVLIIAIALLIHKNSLAQFADPQAVHSLGSGFSLRAQDLDNDGDLDLFGIHNGDHFKFFRNTDGLGTFENMNAFSPVVGGISTYDLADVNGDGLIDIVYVAENSDLVLLVPNLGGGAFASPIPVGNVGDEPEVLRCGDVNGNGLPDLVFSLRNANGGTMAWMPNTGGAFGALITLPSLFEELASQRMILGDLDQNGSLDVVLFDPNGPVVALMNLNGDATNWVLDTLLAFSTYPFQRPVLKDMDGDGDLDVADASNGAIHWAENPINGGNWESFIPRTIEAFSSSGPGAFGDLGCGPGTALVFVPANPGLPVRWRQWMPLLNEFSYAANLPNVQRGTHVLLADLDGDGRDDLVIAQPGGTVWYRNTTVPPVSELQLPTFDTLCLSGAPLPLPAVLPAGGRWSGQWVFDNVLYRANLPSTNTYSLAHTVYEPEGCPIADLAPIRLISGPQILPNIGSVICTGAPPIQMSSSPSQTEWTGLEAGNVLNPATFGGGFIACAYTDATFETCATIRGPLFVWNSLPAQIAPAGPFCVNSGVQVISAQSAPTGGVMWSGDIVDYGAAGANFDPAMGAGTYQVILTVSPTGPQQCGNSDTLTIVISDEFPEVSVPAPSTYCANGGNIVLDGASPEGGIWSGPGVVGNVLDPTLPGLGMHTFTYTLQASTGCIGQASTTISLFNTAVVSYTADDLLFCQNDPAIQFQAQPAGGTWAAPIASNGSLSPASVAPGSYPLSYTFTDPNGCVLSNTPETLQIWAVTPVVITPVMDLCVDDAAVTIDASHAGTWSGAVSGTGSSVVFDPAALGVGTWAVMLNVEVPGECPGSAQIFVVVRACIGIAETDPLAAVFLAPNPFTERTQLTLDAAGPVQVDVMDAAGRRIHSQVIVAQGSTVIPVELGDRPAGTYVVRVQQGNAVRHLRAVKVN